MRRSLAHALVPLLFMARISYGQTAGFSVQPGFQWGRAMGAEQTKQDFRQRGFTLDLNRQTSGTNYWQADHKYPQMGLQFDARFFEKTDGSKMVCSVIPYLEFNVWKSNFGTLQIKHGTGLAYASNRWREGNHPLLGSRLNAATLVDVGYQIRSKSKFEIKAGALLSHVSNGNIVRPNAGLNSTLAYAQLVYFPANKISDRPAFIKQIPRRRWGVRTGTAVGLYDYKKERRRVEHNFQVNVLAVYQHSTRFRSGGGLEVGRLGQGNTLQPAIYLEEEVLIGHLATRYGLGAYLTSPLPDQSRTYEKVGIAWYPGRLTNQVAHGLSLGANIKAHGFKAAHVEVAIACNFE